VYKFTDKQRQRLLEDALVADLLRPASSAQPVVRTTGGRPAVAQVPGRAKAA